MATQLTKNFTLEELTKSDTATRLKVKNEPDKYQKIHLIALANALQSIRDFYGKPIIINCAFRCPKVNSAVGGAATSQHMTGYAADIRPADGNMADLKQAIINWSNRHPYDQIIFEQCDANGIPSWIHFGVQHENKGQRRQKLIAKKVNGKWTYYIYK